LEDYYYIEQAKVMVREKRHVLYVKMSHFEQVSEDDVSFDPADLRQVIEQKYFMVREFLNSAVGQLLTLIDDPNLEQDIKEYLEKDELKLFAAFYDLPMYQGIFDLRADKLGQLITIRGTVTRTTDMKPELLLGTFVCNDCQREVSLVEQQFKVTLPALCPTRGCGNKTNWTLKPEARTTRWGDWQRIRLQENEQEMKAGSMPRSIDVIVRDETCERCKPGDKVKITGCLIVVPDVPSMMNPAELKKQDRRTLATRRDATYSGEGVRGLKSLGNRDLTYKMSFFGVFVDEDHDFSTKGTEDSAFGVGDKFYLSQADKEKFDKVKDHVGPAGKKDCFDVVARSIAPAVQGHDDVKKGILLMLVGGVKKQTEEGIRLRGDLNVCLLGDPATAKSVLLKWTAAFLPRAVYTSGKCSTAAGLTATVSKDMDMDNEKVIEPGALMLADNGVCCIDEFELMNKQDQVAIHEAMEQQTITLSKAGIQATLNARTSILAACLPKHVRYQPTIPLHRNIDMSPPIMSRFDLMFVMQDIFDPVTDNQVAEHIMALHRRHDNTAYGTKLSQADLVKYIKLAKRVTPRITKPAHDCMVRCYKSLRENKGDRGAAGVTVRQLESLVRLSEAVARVHLDSEVKREYVEEAFRLQSDTLRRAQRENIDLTPEAAETDVTDAPVAGDGDLRAPRKLKVTWAEYQRIGQMLARHLYQQSEEGRLVSEENLIGWYMEQREEVLQTEAQLFQEQNLVQLIINRMIDKDRVLVVYKQSEDHDHPEQRILVKHPNFQVGEFIAGSKSHV
jgi:DNA replication licensing factor MCM6